MNILLVDDEAVQLETLGRGLRSRGHGVQAALGGREALNHLVANTPEIHLVLTDFAMPEMNGLELLKAIRENYEELPVVMMTAYSNKDIVIHALRSRCDSFIEKPFTLNELMQEIRSVTARKSRKTDEREKSRYIQMLVHQINNPLACIVGSAELAMLVATDLGAAQKFLSHILKAAGEISSINKRMLDSGRSNNVRLESLDMKDLMEHCLSTFEDVFAFKRIQVERIFENNVSPVTGNKFELEQLFKNLISNSVEAMEETLRKKLIVAISSGRTPHGAVVSIEDCGCGIPEESLKKVFAPYFTLKSNGSGLGLAVAKAVVEKHNGWIQVAGKSKRGAKFTVCLPYSGPVQESEEKSQGNGKSLRDLEMENAP